MKRLPLFLIALTLSWFSVSAQTCCDLAATSPNADFAALGAQTAFQDAHPDPARLELIDAKGTEVTFLTPDGKPGNGYYLASASKSNKYLLVIHEWWGLNNHIRQEAERLHAALGDVHVLALDLYDGKVATDRKTAASYMQGADEGRIRAIIRGALNNIGAEAQVQTIGWCFGGGWSHQASIMAATQGAGCVIYYGMPEVDQAKLKPLQADVLGIFAGQDQWINGEVVRNFEAAMQQAGKSISTKTFDAAHAFANPSRAIYDKKAADEANQMSLAFLQSHFK